MRLKDIIKYYHRFHDAMCDLEADYSRVTHPFAAIPYGIARLACLIHAASVHSEPGSNSPKKTWLLLAFSLLILWKPNMTFSVQEKGLILTTLLI